MIRSDYKPFWTNLINFLQGQPDGTVFVTAELDKVAGISIREKPTVIFMTKKYLEKKGKLLTAVRGYGYKLLDSTGKIGESIMTRDSGIKRINKSLKKFRTVDPATLDQSQSRQFTTELGKTLLLSEMCSTVTNPIMDQSKRDLSKISQADILKAIL